MWLPVGFVPETRYERLIRAAKAMRLEEGRYDKLRSDPKSKAKSTFTAEIADLLFEHLGNRVRNIVPAAVFHLPGWLALAIWDVMSTNGRVDLEQGQLVSVKRRFSPMPTVADLTAFLVENHLPRIALPKESYLSPRDLASAVVDTLIQAEAVEAYASNEIDMLGAAVRNIAYDARQGKFDVEADKHQFEKTLFNMVLTGAFDHPSLQGRAALEPVMNKESMVILDKIKSRTQTACALDLITLYGRGSVDGTIAAAMLYAPKLPVCQGTIFEYEKGNLANNGVVKINMKQVAEFGWNLDRHLIGAMETIKGSLVYSSGAPELANEAQAKVPLRLVTQEGLFDRSIVMDHPSVRIVYRMNQWWYEFQSNFRNRTIVTMSDNEFLLDRLMDARTKTSVANVPVEMMNLDKLTNAVLVTSPNEAPYVVPPVEAFPVTFLRSTGAQGFVAETRSVDMRSVYGYANYLCRPALAPNVQVSLDALHEPREAEVRRLCGLLSLDDLSAEASQHLLTISFNAAWLKMVVGTSPDPDPLIKLYISRATR